MYITKQSDDITFHYDGLKGYFNITFEAGAIYNGNYYSMAEVKQMKPEIQFNFPSRKYLTHRKYAVNITNITLNKTKLEYITLTYKSHYGLTLTQLKKNNRWYSVKNTMALYFEDLLEKFTINIDASEKRIYIGNISANMVDGSLYLDPTVQLQDAESENLRDTYVQEDDADANKGTLNYIDVGSYVAGNTHSYIMFNISSIPSGMVIADAVIALHGDAGTPCNGNLSIYHVLSHNWISDSTGEELNETTMTWNNQTCGTNFDNDTHCSLTIVDSVAGLIGAEVWQTMNVLDPVKSEYDNNDNNVSFVLKHEGPTGNVTVWESKEETTASNRPYLNVTYVTEYPTWWNNQTSIPSEYNPDNSSQFNITWNGSVLDVDKALIELNGTNYTMTRGAYILNISNYSMLLSAGNYDWKSFANNTEDTQNVTDTWSFTISKNSSNVVHLNMSRTGFTTNSTNYNISAYTDQTVNISCSMHYTSSGSCSLYVDDVLRTSPYGSTFGAGEHAVKVNSSGNQNYTANTTGATYYVIATTKPSDAPPAGGGGGGARRIIIHECDLGYIWDEQQQECVPIPPGMLTELPPIYEIEEAILTPRFGPISLFHIGIGLLALYSFKSFKMGRHRFSSLLTIAVVVILLIMLFRGGITTAIDQSMDSVTTINFEAERDKIANIFTTQTANIFSALTHISDVRPST